MALRLQQIEIKRWHADVDLLVNQLASLVSNFFHRHPTSNMRQDIWPAIWENNAVENSWTIHYTILVFFSVAASSNCASLIKIHSLGKGGGGGDRLCFCLWVCRTSAHDNNNNISFHFLSWKNVTFWIFRREEGRFCLFASEHIVGVSDVRWWQACIEKGGGKPWQVDHDRREALNGLCTHAVQSPLLYWWTTRRMLSATCCMTHFNNKW